MKINIDMKVDTPHTVTKTQELSDFAAGHLDIVRAYLGVQAWVGVVAAPLFVLQTLFRGFGHLVTAPHISPWLVLPMLAINTSAAFRARRLLGEHDPEGVWIAATMLASDMVAGVTTGHVLSGTLVSGTALLLLGSAYRGMRAATKLRAAVQFSQDPPPDHMGERADELPR